MRNGPQARIKQYKLCVTLFQFLFVWTDRCHILTHLTVCTSDTFMFPKSCVYCAQLICLDISAASSTTPMSFCYRCSDVSNRPRCECFVDEYVNNNNKKLRYRIKTAQRAIPDVWELESFKQQVTFKVNQGYWQWCHLIVHIRFPISVPLQLCLYVAPFPRYYYMYSVRLVYN